MSHRPRFARTFIGDRRIAALSPDLADLAGLSAADRLQMGTDRGWLAIGSLIAGFGARYVMDRDGAGEELFFDHSIILADTKVTGRLILGAASVLTGTLNSSHRRILEFLAAPQWRFEFGIHLTQGVCHAE